MITADARPRPRPRPQLTFRYGASRATHFAKNRGPSGSPPVSRVPCAVGRARSTALLRVSLPLPLPDSRRPSGKDSSPFGNERRRGCDQGRHSGALVLRRSPIVERGGDAIGGSKDVGLESIAASAGNRGASRGSAGPVAETAQAFSTGPDAAPRDSRSSEQLGDWTAPPSIQPTRGSTIPAPASTVRAIAAVRLVTTHEPETGQSSWCEARSWITDLW